MSYKSKNKTVSRWTNVESTSKNKTVKNRTQVCNLGINGTMKPCCDKDTSGHQCHVKPNLLDQTKRLTRNDSMKMSNEHDEYKEEETKLLGSSGLMPSKYDIARRYTLHGLDAIKNERYNFKRIIKMRTDWLKKWYVPPSPSSDCYTCDANARNHNVRIDILTRSLDDYNEFILKNEKKNSVSSRTRSNVVTSKQRPRLNLTRKKKESYRVDSVERRQKLAAMLTKKKESQDRRKKSYSMKKTKT
jgi:hypothetical protein